MKFGAVLDVKVNTKKVNLDVINKWVSERITELLGFEDDIVIGTVINSIETANPDPKKVLCQRIALLKLNLLFILPSHFLC